MSRQAKTLSFQVKDLGTRTDDAGQEFGQIEAYGAIFNNVDEGKDRILPGAFKRTIRSAKDRAASRDKKYLAPMLWQHDTNELIGGWYDISEDEIGLKAKGDINLATQRGREYYALAKAGMADQFSIIYDVPTGGAKYDKSGVRDLSEMRLFSIDPVTFAMNDETYTIDVKSRDRKAAGDDSVTVCGNTKGPIGPRDEAWDGGKAETQIWDAAYDAESDKIDTALAKKYFMVCDGDGSEKGDYAYPFWYVGSDPHICVGAVKAIAAAIQGSRGASAPDALKPKIETLYKRINAKYPDDAQLTAPWLSDAKARGRAMQKKTFEQHYQEEQCADLLEDWQDIILTAFTQAVHDAFTIGDVPESDVAAALDGLKTAVTEWVANAVKVGLSDYLDDIDSTGYDPGLSRMLNGSSSGGYDWMSRTTPMQRKALRKAMMESDGTTGGMLADPVATLRDTASKARKTVRDHANDLHEKAQSVKDLLENARNTKAGRAFSAAHEQALSDHADALDDAADALNSAMKAHMKSVTTVADDLATVLQGSEAAYGTDPGTPEDGQQEGKHLLTRASSAKTRANSSTVPSSQRSDTATSEDEITAALAAIRALRTN